MPLSLTTRRRQQTSNAKWYSQQYHKQQQYQQDITTTTTTTTKHNLIRPHIIHQPVKKQRSFIDSRLSIHPERSKYLSRGLSVERSHDIPHQRLFNKSLLKTHSTVTAQAFNGSNERESLKTDVLKQQNITACVKKADILRTSTSNKTQAWSSTSSILKTLDKELAQLNGIVGKCKDVKKATAKNVNLNSVNSKAKEDPIPKTYSPSSNTPTSRKPIKSEINKVNLSIVLSHALNSTKENDFIISEPDENESDDLSTDSTKCVNSQTKYKNSKKSDNIKSSVTTVARPVVSAQQRRALYHNSRLTSNLALTNNNINPSPNITCGLENSSNFNASPSLTVQKRPPLVRAMSAPVRSFDETCKGSFLAARQKSRRRKLSTRNGSCDKGTSDVIAPKDVNLSRKVLTRSKSVAPDVITLVSLISSEGSDSESEDNTGTPIISHTSSPSKRPPSLRKTGKSVSFQENYPTTFQFASKEYSHMLRRSSIAPLAQRIKINRPPTAPPVSIFHTALKMKKDISGISNENEEKENLTNSINNSDVNDSNQNSNLKLSEENYEYPEYVRGVKERECWKLYKKMSTKGVNITYDTILRGMLTPTEFRQLQKQRELEESKTKENVNNSVLEESKPNDPPTAIERLKESLLKN